MGKAHGGQCMSELKVYTYFLSTDIVFLKGPFLSEKKVILCKISVMCSDGTKDILTEYSKEACSASWAKTHLYIVKASIHLQVTCFLMSRVPETWFFIFPVKADIVHAYLNGHQNTTRPNKSHPLSSILCSM